MFLDDPRSRSGASSDPKPSVSPVRLEMPVARNRWIVFWGLGVAAPWLMAFLVGSIVAPIISPESLRREAILGAIAINLLFLIVHILAVMGVWLAFYKLRGSETIEITRNNLSVRRSALGISVPMRLRRVSSETVEVLSGMTAPGRGAHPRLEYRAGSSAVRFGAGLSAAEAENARARVLEALSSTI